MLGVVTQSPESEVCDQYVGRQRFWRKRLFFCGGEEYRRKTLGVRLRSTNLGPCTSPGTNLDRNVGGTNDNHCANLTPHHPSSIIFATEMITNITKQ